jgi:hypothetical protein
MRTAGLADQRPHSITQCALQIPNLEIGQILRQPLAQELNQIKPSAPPASKLRFPTIRRPNINERALPLGYSALVRPS